MIPNYRLFLLVQCIFLLLSFLGLEFGALVAYGSGIGMGILLQYMGVSWVTIERMLKDAHVMVLMLGITFVVIPLSLQWFTGNSDFGLLWVLLMLGCITSLVTLQRTLDHRKS